MSDIKTGTLCNFSIGEIKDCVESWVDGKIRDNIAEFLSKDYVSEGAVLFRELTNNSLGVFRLVTALKLCATYEYPVEVYKHDNASGTKVLLKWDNIIELVSKMPIDSNVSISIVLDFAKLM